MITTTYVYEKLKGWIMLEQMKELKQWTGDLD
jgi:hypothetical protein